MQPAVLLRVRVRLVPGVDDRPLQRRFQADLDLEEVGPLADLEAVVPAVGARCRPARPRRPPAGRRKTGSGAGRSRRTAWPGSSGSSRGSRRRHPCCRCCSCTAASAGCRGWRAAWTAASAITRSPALSQITAASGSVHSGAEYSGCAWSTYSRAPLVRITLARPRSSSVSWAESATSRARSNPRASRSGFSSSKSQRARRARAEVAAWYAFTTCEELTIAFAPGWPGTECRTRSRCP